MHVVALIRSAVITDCSINVHNWFSKPFAKFWEKREYSASGANLFKEYYWYSNDICTTFSLHESICPNLISPLNEPAHDQQPYQSIFDSYKYFLPSRFHKNPLLEGVILDNHILAFCQGFSNFDQWLCGKKVTKVLNWRILGEK